jgi:hypothetical protein
LLDYDKPLIFIENKIDQKITNLNRSLKIWAASPVKCFEIHKVIHSFCGQLWKSPKDKRFG